MEIFDHIAEIKEWKTHRAADHSDDQVASLVLRSELDCGRHSEQDSDCLANICQIYLW